MNDLQAILQDQRKFFQTGRSKDLDYRKSSLAKFKACIKANEAKIAEALKADLNKCAEESYLTETGMILSSIDYNIRHLKSWSKPKSKPSAMAIFPATARVVPEPYGSVLIMAPWNYPLLLALDPLAAAVAAGNCVVVKPSEMAPQSSKLICEIIRSVFVPEHVYAIECEADEIDRLLSCKFDYIFFTGSPEKGKSVMKKAAENLTPVTLELGGKSPFIIDEETNLELAAKRLAFGKILNAGQTCVAPDYVFLHEKHKDSFPLLFDKYVKSMLPEKSESSYTRIVNPRHFERLSAYLNNGKILMGGNCNFSSLQIEPTLIEVSDMNSPIMKDEIFGPIAPVIYFKDIAEVITYVNSGDKPLALYLFSNNKKHQNAVLSQISFGGGCINDCIMHLVPASLPFGGVGKSGMGSYHGKYGFDTFTHYKAMIKQSSTLDLAVRYRPYNKIKNMLVKMFLK